MKNKLFSVAAYILIPLLILVVLFLPPISLFDRLLSSGYQTISAEGGTVQTPDGAALTVPPLGGSGQIWVRLDSVPETDAAGPLADAVAAIPPALTLSSPLYQIQHRGNLPAGAALLLPLPAEPDAYHTLDLYGWDGMHWRWLANQKNNAAQTIQTTLSNPPQAVAVMNTRPLRNVQVSDSAEQTILAELHPAGLVLDAAGKISGQPAPTAAGDGLAVIPTLRNWRGDSVNDAAVNAMLASAEGRSEHARAVAAWVQANSAAGIALDYRGIAPNLQPEFTEFVTELRRTLPDTVQLSVRTPAPRPISAGGWDTGAVDVQAVAQAADVIEIPASPNPHDYAANGAMPQLLDWAVSRANRAQIQLALNTGSTEQVEQSVRAVDTADALAKIGTVTADVSRVVLPGEEIDFRLAGSQATTGVQVDDASGATWFAYLDDNNRHHTVYLENPAGVVPAVQLAADYHLRGVALESAGGNADT
ncbi:MAG: hypothetical protein D6768_05120, partial [Chloroflexi bacterium]